MTTFTQQLSFRWSDLDPNFHLRHSVYYDFGAQQRIEVLTQLGITAKRMQEEHFGLIIFREECIFRKEIRLTDTVFITAVISKMRKDGARWTFRHEFINAEKQVLATLTLDVAWLDTEKRKLASPTPAVVVDALDRIPKSDDFVWF